MGYIDTSNQVATFLWSLLLGVVMCIAYDFIRAVHKVSIKGFFEVMLTDLLFWGIWALITFCFLVLRCKGEVRGYVLFGQLVGFTISRVTLSKVTYLMFIYILKLFLKIFRLFGNKIHSVLKAFEKNIKKFLKYLKKVLQHKAKLLYNLLKIHNK